MAEEEIIGFSRQDASEILRQIQAGTLGGSGISTYDATALTLAYASSGVPARSGTTLGKGTVDIKYLAVSGANRVITDAAKTMDAYNLSTTAVGSAKYVLLLRLGDVGIVIWEEC